MYRMKLNEHFFFIFNPWKTILNFEYPIQHQDIEISKRLTLSI